MGSRGFFMGVFLAANALPAAPTLESIESLALEIQEKAQVRRQVATLEDVLFAIGEKYPVLRENHVLVFESLSRQQASPGFPRIIAHTPEGRFAMAFNGHPDHAGFQELEMYDFQEKPGAGVSGGEVFRFRRIVFDKTGPVPKPVNEALCRSCHGGESLRPNWESYSLWEGVYPRTDQVAHWTKYRLGYSEAEQEGFDDFYTRQAKSGRYLFLQGLESRYLNPVKGGYENRVAPSQFTQLVGYLNYRRLSRLIQRTPQYEIFKYAILAGLYRCQNFPAAYLPPSVREQISANHVWANTKMRFNADPNRFFLEDMVEQIGNLRYLMEGRGISMAGWSLSFRGDNYSFVTPLGSFEGFLSAILSEQDPSLEPFTVYRLQDEGNGAVSSQFSIPWTGNWSTMTSHSCQALRVESCRSFGEIGLPCEP